MSWRTITATNVQGRLTAAEAALLSSASGVGSKLAERVADAVATFRGTISAAGWNLGAQNTIPDGERNHVMSYAIWEWMKDFPQLDKFKTKERSAAYEDALDALSKIRLRTYGAIEDPAGQDNTTGNWNSKPKLVGRTDPHPTPAQQLQISPSPIYANQNAPGDAIPPNSPGIPDAPLNAAALVVGGQVVVYWNPVVGADKYAIYRSETSGQEGVVEYAEATGTNYTDAAVVAGHRYFYRVATVMGQIVSGQSNEASVQL